MIALVVYFVMTTPSFQQVFISSDQLTIVSVADDMIKNPLFNAFDWSWPRAPYLLPDLLTTIALRLVIPNDIVVATMMLVLQSACVAAAGLAISASFAETRAGRAPAVTLYGVTTIAALIGTRHGWPAGAVIWPFVSYSHAGALDLTLIGFYALSRNLYVPAGRPYLLSLSAALTILAYCSDKIAIVFFLPSASIYFLARMRSDRFRPFAAFLSIQVVAILIVMGLDHSLHFQIMEDNSLRSLPAHAVHAINFIMRQRLSFRLFSSLMITATVVAFLHSSVVLLRSRGQDRDQSALIFLLSSSSLVNIPLLLWLWSNDDPAYARYGVMIQFAGPICSTYLVLLRPLRPATCAKVIPVLCTVVLLVASTWQGTLNPFEMIAVQKRTGADLQACVAKHGLHSGYAGYWLARQLSSSTNWKVQVDQFMPADPVPFFWGSDVIWYYNRLRDGGENRHDFIIMNDLPEYRILAEYGRPDEITDCGEHRFAIYRRPDRLESRVDFHLGSVLSMAGVAHYLPERVRARIDEGRLAFGVDDLSSAVGLHQSGSITLSPHDGPGYGLFGPWIPLSAGSYHVVITFTCSGDLTGSYLEIAAGDQHQRVIGWLFEDHPAACNGETQHATMSLAGPLSMVEVRTYYGGRGELSVSDVMMGRGFGGS